MNNPYLIESLSRARLVELDGERPAIDRGAPPRARRHRSVLRHAWFTRLGARRTSAGRAAGGTPRSSGRLPAPTTAAFFRRPSSQPHALWWR